MFKEIQVVELVLDMNVEYNLKWTLPLHRQVRSLYTQNLVLKRRLKLVNQQLTKANKYGTKRNKEKLDILAEMIKGKSSSGGFYWGLNFMFLLKNLEIDQFWWSLLKHSKGMLHVLYSLLWWGDDLILAFLVVFWDFIRMSWHLLVFFQHII